MTVGILKLILFIPASNSLKAKRMILHSLKARLRNNFNLAVSQIDDEDKWQKATLAIVGVEKDKKSMHAILSKAISFAEGLGSVNIINYEMEMI